MYSQYSAANTMYSQYSVKFILQMTLTFTFAKNLNLAKLIQISGSSRGL